jgi:hypothetical protein
VEVLDLPGDGDLSTRKADRQKWDCISSLVNKGHLIRE